MPAITSSSPGKTILFGEHAVVYGFPAIAVPINSIQLKISLLGAPDQPQGSIRLRNYETGEDVVLSELGEGHPLNATLQIIAAELKVDHFPAAVITISSTIPIASGLGSSAALAVALVRGFSQFVGFNLNDQRINDLAFEVEKIQHGTPSGIDNSVIAFNKPLYYVKGQPAEFLTFEKPLTLVIADTGIRSLTREVVAEVRARREKEPAVVIPLLSQIGVIAQTAREKLIHTDLLAVGSLMNENQRLLQKLGVSCLELERLVDAARKAGALGAKLCGSGKGGNIIAITQPEQAESIRDALLANGAVRALCAEVK
jgi:mevalonate kinase